MHHALGKWTKNEAIGVLFLFAGASGLSVLGGLLWLGAPVGLTYPPSITGATEIHARMTILLLAQIPILVVGLAPLRLRALMLSGVVEKISAIGFVAWVALAGGTIEPWFAAVTGGDGILAVAFAASWFSTRFEERLA